MTATRKKPANARAKNATGAKQSAKTNADHAKVPAVLRATEGHRGDLAGLALIALGVLNGMGAYANAGGPVGRGVASAVAWLLGPMHYLMPVLFVVLGVWCIKGVTATKIRDETEPDPSLALFDAQTVALRRAIGIGIVILACLGLLDIWRGHPDLRASGDALRNAGGFLGALVGVPLRAVLAPIGATVFLGLCGLAGIVLFTGVPIARAAGASVDGVRPAGNALKRLIASLFRLDESAAATHDGTQDGNHDAPDVSVIDYAQDVASRSHDDDVGESTSRSDEVDDEPDPMLYDQDQDTDVPALDPTLEISPPAKPSQLQIDLEPSGARRVWKLPPAKLLKRTAAHEVDKSAIRETGEVLEHALAEHGVETRLVGMTIGPTVTRYELELGPGVKVARVTSLHKDIAYAMATPDVRILAPIPGRQAIGVEVPNSRKQLVSVGDILASPEAKKARHPLDAAVGRDIAGKAVLANLATMPHVLIAGATGAGKSSCINTLLTSLLMRGTPDDLRLILIDPKRVELGQYNRLPHLLTEVVTNPKKAANALSWAVKEMERRYDLLSEVGVRDVSGYNAAFDRGDLVPPAGLEKTYERLPYILVVVDELNDLMMVAARDVEESITRIAQMARAVGIHLVVATQRPSVNVITGVIKANIPARWAFAVSSLADSRVILDQPGAEKLLGKGDMLLLGPASSIPVRIQGSWVTEEEVHAVVAHWRRQQPEVVYDTTVQGSDETPSSGGGGSTGNGDDDDLLVEAMELVVRSQLGSTSMLQRKLRVGFARAGRLMDLLEQRGVVGPSEGSKARAVLMTIEEFEAGASSSLSPAADDASDEGAALPPDDDF